MMPHPLGNRSSRRIGHGFQISKTRNQMKPNTATCQALKTSKTSIPAKTIENAANSSQTT